MSTIKIPAEYSWNSTSNTTTTDFTVRFDSNTRSVRLPSPPTRTGSNGCNESKAHDNEEKALYHSLKGAWRMSREYDGKEYGTDDPQYEYAARMAANAALAYMAVNDVTYNREDSFEYLKDNVVTDWRTIDRVLGLFGIRDTNLDHGDMGADDFSDGLDRAWSQIDDKRHHDDAARTALASAEAYLGEALYP